MVFTLFISFHAKDPPKPFLLLWQEDMQHAPPPDVSESCWGVKQMLLHHRFPPGPHIPQSSLERVCSQCPAVSWLWAPRRVDHSTGNVYCVLRMPQLKWSNYLLPASLHQSQWEKAHVAPCGTPHDGDMLNVPYLPNGCLQACPCSLCPCFILPLPPGWSSISSSPLTHISACLPCVLGTCGLVQQVNLCALFLLLL